MVLKFIRETKGKEGMAVVLASAFMLAPLVPWQML